MNRIITALLLLSFAVIGTSCDQDPLAKKAEEIKNAKPIKDLPQKPEAIESSAILIDVPNSISFTEENPSYFIVSSRVLVDGYSKISYSIENLDQFPGAKLDSATGEFSWTPPAGFVEKGIYTDGVLKVRAFAIPDNSNGQVLTRMSEIHTFIYKNLKNPIITKVDGFPDTIRENSEPHFTVEVVDFGSGEDPKDVPMVIFSESDSTALDLSGFIHRESFTFDANQKKWKFNFKILLAGLELTSNSSNFSMNIETSNKYGLKSNFVNVKGKVLTKLSFLQTNWDTKLILKPGIEQKINFVVFDPKGEGILNYKKSSFYGPVNSKLDCKGYKTLTCEYSVIPVGKPDSMKNEYFQFEFTSNNSDGTDSEILTQKFNLSYQIEKVGPNPQSNGKGELQ